MTAPSAGSDLFAFAEAQALRDTGMTQAEGNAPIFTVRALRAIEAIARRQPEVHIDDVLTVDIGAPAHPNAWGGVWRAAIRRGFIVATGRTRPCETDSKKHAHQYPVYASLIFAPEAAR
ncbi:MAG: hypothetical protein AB7U62_19200 [Pseudolabrys sp.]